jgi:hypothetical protein
MPDAFKAARFLVLFGEHVGSLGDVDGGSFCLSVLAAHAMATDHDGSLVTPAQKILRFKNDVRSSRSLSWCHGHVDVTGRLSVGPTT